MRSIDDCYCWQVYYYVILLVTCDETILRLLTSRIYRAAQNILNFIVYVTLFQVCEFFE